MCSIDYCANTHTYIHTNAVTKTAEKYIKCLFCTLLWSLQQAIKIKCFEQSVGRASTAFMSWLTLIKLSNRTTVSEVINFLLLML